MENNQLQDQRNTQTDMMIARQSQEVQVAMLAAKKFPRDQVTAMARIKAACQRMSVATQAIYTYPRGGERISGPSIRLAEVIAQNWGNIESGVIELDNHDGQSEMMAYAWDLETNARDSKIFTVKHIREKKTGNVKLSGDRDIYELTANFAARRKRACIMAVVPSDVVEMAVRECKATIAAGDQRPTSEIVDGLLKAFKEMKVTKEQLEKFVGKSLAVATREDLTDLRGVYKAIKDGQSKTEDYFPKPVINEETKVKIKDEAAELAAALESEAENE
jgi:hypothetical protein